MSNASDLPIKTQNRLAKVKVGDHVVLVHSDGRRRDVLIQGLPGDPSLVGAKIIWVNPVTNEIEGAKNVPYGRTAKGGYWVLPEEVKICESASDGESETTCSCKV